MPALNLNFTINKGAATLSIIVSSAKCRYAEYYSECRSQTWSRLRNWHRKLSRIDSRSIRFRFVPIRYEVSKYRIVIDFFDFGIYICMFSEKSVLFRYYRNVTDSYRKKVITSKITVLLPIFFPPSLFHRFDQFSPSCRIQQRQWRSGHLPDERNVGG